MEDKVKANGSDITIKKWGVKDFLKDYTLYITLVISLLTALFITENTLRSTIVPTGAAMIGMSAALLGIVIAGLAIFIAFSDKKYIILLNQFNDIGNELLPIKTVVILNISCLIFGLVLILASNLSNGTLHLIFLLALWNYFYLLVQMYELFKWLFEHAKTRIIQIQKEEADQNL